VPRMQAAVKFKARMELVVCDREIRLKHSLASQETAIENACSFHSPTIVIVVSVRVRHILG
jgi:hypothetical protein